MSRPKRGFLVFCFIVLILTGVAMSMNERPIAGVVFLLGCLLAFMLGIIVAETSR